MILTNNTSSKVGRLACLFILAIVLTVLPFSVQARAQDDSSSDLEKRITRLEKLVDILRKALNSNVPSDNNAGVARYHVHPDHNAGVARYRHHRGSVVGAVCTAVVYGDY